MIELPTYLLVLAGKNLFKIFIENWDRTYGEDRKQNRIKKWLKRNYLKLSRHISVDCVKLLIVVEYGKKYKSKDYLKKIHPKLKIRKKNLDILIREFEYRLNYLVLLGVLDKGPEEYSITRLGRAFLSTARARYAYPSVLSPNN